MNRERDIYIAIMVAAANGRGMHLTAAECHQLTCDNAIETRAANGLDEIDFEKMTGDHRFWETADPYRKRTPANGAA